ncbi:hypothetical protein KY290_026061 [Solanum tuberosum]|uniref:Uncharacterized protein n=1 Tax=Solanum tuberosum TaxID=4113 RepID=A0ABQ7UVC9_SOLTU|nr:hypothetical protein KY290_026061 [Solanum tuberosum]
MEGTLVDDRFKPPNPSTVMLKPIISSSLQESSSELTYSSSQVRDEAIHTAMEKELEGTRINNPMEDASQIRGKGLGGKDSQFQDVHNSQKSHDFPVPFERNPLATEARNSGESSQNRHQNQSTVEEIHADSAIGSGNIGREGHNIATSSTFHGGIAGAGDSAGIPSKNVENFQYVEEIRGLSQTQTQHREGKQHVQDLGQSSTPHMEEQFIKKQGMDTSIIHNNSRLNVLLANQTQLNSDPEHLRNENDQ